MRGLAVMMVALAFAGSVYAQDKPAPSNPVMPSGPFSLSVALSIDAPPDIQWILTDGLTRRLKNVRPVTVVAKDPEWVIAVVAFDPFPKEKDSSKKQFSMSTAFIRQLVWTDPAILAEIRKDPCLPAARLAEFQSTQRKIGDLFTIGSYAGRMSELNSTIDDIVDDFSKQVLEPAKKSHKATASRALQKPLTTNQPERPKTPPVPPVKKP